MKLLLDIGNTRIKWARLDGGLLREQQALPLSDLRDAVLSEQVFAPQARPERVCVSNVAGDEMATRIRHLARQRWQMDAEFLASSAQARVRNKLVRNAYREPAKLGVDRWLALLGAAEQDRAALVVSVGTAMTLDALDATGRHVGGLIVPGPQLMMSSLLSNTSDIAGRATPESGPSDASAYFADSTRGCITAGARHACGALIAAAYARLQQHDALVWLTGGAAPLLLDELTMPVRHVPDLVLRGMATQV